jgi:hypothetical protein
MQFSIICLDFLFVVRSEIDTLLGKNQMLYAVKLAMLIIIKHDEGNISESILGCGKGFQNISSWSFSLEIQILFWL